MSLLVCIGPTDTTFVLGNLAALGKGRVCIFLTVLMRFIVNW